MTIAVAIVAAIAAVLSAVFVWLQVREMQVQTRLQREISQAAAQPYVWVDIRLQSSNGWVLELVVGNSGTTVARNVRVVIDPPFPDTTNSGTSMKDAQAVLRKGLSSLAPGRVLRWSIDGSVHVIEANKGLNHLVTVDCDGPFGAVETSQFHIVTDEWKDSAAVAVGTLRDVQKAIADVAKRIPNLRNPVPIELVTPESEDEGFAR